MSQRILLGSAPRPTDGAQIAKRIRKLMVAAEPAGIACTAVIDAELDGADVSRLRINLTDYVFGPAQDRDRSRIEPQGAPVSREEGVLKNLHVHGDPVRLPGADVRLNLELQDLPFEWIETDANELAVSAVAPSTEQPVHGSLKLSVPKEQLAEAVRMLAEPVLREHGLTLSTFTLEVTNVDDRTVRVSTDAKLKKGLIGAMTHGEATATIDDRLGVTLSDLSVESGNPLVAALLSAARGRIEQFEGRRFDIAAMLPPGVQLTDVKLRAGEQVELEARLA